MCRQQLNESLALRQRAICILRGTIVCFCIVFITTALKMGGRG